MEVDGRGAKPFLVRALPSPALCTSAHSPLVQVYDALIDALATLLVENSVEYFTASVAAGAIPVELVDEMRGLSDGARSANVSSPAAFENLVAINTGYDMLLALIFR